MKKAHYNGVPCYYDEETGELEGRNKFYDILVDIHLWFDINVFEVDSFEIWVDVEEENDDKLS